MSFFMILRSLIAFTTLSALTLSASDSLSTNLSAYNGNIIGSTSSRTSRPTFACVYGNTLYATGDNYTGAPNKATAL